MTDFIYNYLPTRYEATEADWSARRAIWNFKDGHMSESLYQAILSKIGEGRDQLLNIYFGTEDKLFMQMDPNAETPEGMEITAKLYYDSINSIEIRVDEIERFPVIAGAFIRALYPESMSAEAAMKAPADRAKLALENPENSFVDEVEELNGTVPRTYYAYLPDQYHDGVNWIQLTIIFPLAGYWEPNGTIIDGATPTKAPDVTSDHDPEYEGYYSQDPYLHYEFFTTPTPEPDSPAGEEETGLGGFPLAP